eukprot:g70628.t1
MSLLPPTKRQRRHSLRIQAKATAISRLNSLPDSLILELFQFFTFKELRSRLIVICRRLRELANDAGSLGFAVDLNLLPAGKSGDTKHMEAALSFLSSLGARKQIHTVTFGSHTFDRNSLTTLLALCPNLRHLNCRTSLNVHINGFSDRTVAKAPELRQFKCEGLLGVKQSDVLNLVHNRTNLQQLVLSGVEAECGGRPPLDDCFLQALGAHCPELTHLHLSGAFRFTDTGISALIGGCPKLSSFILLKHLKRSPSPPILSLSPEAQEMIRNIPGITAHLWLYGGELGRAFGYHSRRGFESP